jgi:hypothetical protein
MWLMRHVAAFFAARFDGRIGMVVIFGRLDLVPLCVFPHKLFGLAHTSTSVPLTLKYWLLRSMRAGKQEESPQGFLSREKRGPRENPSKEGALNQHLDGTCTCSF